MREEEEYPGGFTSLDLGDGYRIYATNKRIIGIKMSGNSKAKGALIGRVVGGICGVAAGAALTRDQSTKMIEEFEKKKEFEQTKDLMQAFLTHAVRVIG